MEEGSPDNPVEFISESCSELLAEMDASLFFKTVVEVGAAGGLCRGMKEGDPAWLELLVES